MSDYRRIRYEVRDRIAEITMIREPVNAIDMTLAHEVVHAYGRVREDQEVRGVILTSGCRQAFSAGMDRGPGLSGAEWRQAVDSGRYQNA